MDVTSKWPSTLACARRRPERSQTLTTAELREPVRRCRLLVDIDHVAAADAATSERQAQGGFAVPKRYLIMPPYRMRAATAIRLCLDVRTRVNTGTDVDIRGQVRHHDIQATRQ
jgi:hypothetical protein